MHATLCPVIVMLLRNALVGASGLDSVKLSDVGLSRTLASSDYYRKTSAMKVPLKWLAPESALERVYSTASDVWSYGVLCWEVFSFGDTPYPGLKTSEIVLALQRGYRMSKPARCPESLFGGACLLCGVRSLSRRFNEVMKQAWQEYPGARPTFQRIVTFLQGLGEGETRL